MNIEPTLKARMNISQTTIEELVEMEDFDDPSLVFHGTSSCYSDQIETNGWPVDWRPFDWDDIRFVLTLSEQVKLGGYAFLWFNHESQYKNNRGGYFTYILEGAVQYSGATGGETVRCALRQVRLLMRVLANIPQHSADLLRLSRLNEVWTPLVFDSLPVVYAVRINDEAFPDERFGGLVSRSTSSFRYQLKEYGKVLNKSGDFWAMKDVEASAIVAKAALSASVVEELQLT